VRDIPDEVLRKVSEPDLFHKILKAGYKNKNDVFNHFAKVQIRFQISEDKFQSFNEF
jgi:hypothetical protein